jgi:prolipoprotein diacylglyceryltransferase
MLGKKINKVLDKFIRPEVHVGCHSWSAFKVCGYTGLALATLLAMSLVLRLGLSPWLMGGIILSAILTFFGLSILTSIVAGEEHLIYYHHEIAIIIVASALLRLSRQPTLAYLDVTILGLGLFLACGRVGCLMVGCCHGMPHHWGVRYQAEHAAADLNPYCIGVRLFPVQALESMWVFGTVISGIALVLIGQPPGAAFAWYVVVYGLGRFFFEFIRGDAERPYYLGFSEAQWTSLLLLCAVTWAELTGTLAFRSWHLGATAFLGMTMIAIAIRRVMQGTSSYLLLHPRHMREVAEAVQLASNLAVERCDICKQNPTPLNVHIGCTSLDVQVSASKIKSTVGYIYHYTLSRQNGSISEEIAKSLAQFILRIKHPSETSDFIQGNRGIFHLLVHASATADTLWLEHNKPRR